MSRFHFGSLMCPSTRSLHATPPIIIVLLFIGRPQVQPLTCYSAFVHRTLSAETREKDGNGPVSLCEVPKLSTRGHAKQALKSGVYTSLNATTREHPCSSGELASTKTCISIATSSRKVARPNSDAEESPMLCAPRCKPETKTSSSRPRYGMSSEPEFVDDCLLQAPPGSSEFRIGMFPLIPAAPS